MKTYLADEACDMRVGTLVGRMLPDMPLIPIDAVQMTIDGDTALIEWDRVIVSDDDGNVAVENDEAKIVERHGQVLLRVVAASWVTGDAA